MSKAVLISIRPQWCELIANGKKTIEVRKTRPKIETPFKCYIYCTIRPPYLVYGNVFDGGSFVDKYCLTHGYSKSDADRIWGTMNGKVIGEFVCDRIEDYSEWKYDHAALLRHIDLYAATNGDYKFLSEYIPEKKGFGWHISDLVIYDEPKKLQEFYGYCNGYCGSYCKWYSQCSISEYSCALNCRPPQSWCYVEVSE